VAQSAASVGGPSTFTQTVVGATLLSLVTTFPEWYVPVMGDLRRQPGIMVTNTVVPNHFLCTFCGGLLFVGGDVE